MPINFSQTVVYYNVNSYLTLACALLVVVLQTVSSEFSVGTESSTQSGEQVAASVAATLHPTVSAKKLILWHLN